MSLPNFRWVRLSGLFWKTNSSSGKSDRINPFLYTILVVIVVLPEKLECARTNVNVCTTDDFTKGVDALVYEIDEANELMKIAYPLELFDRNMIDGRAMIVSFLTLTIGNNQGMGDVEYGKMLDFYVPPKFRRLFDGPAKNIVDMWRILGRPLENGGMVVGTIIKPKLGLRPKPFADACYQFWLGGDFIKNDEPQGNQVFAPMREIFPLIVDSMKRAQDETGEAKLFSANITADDPFEMIRRGEYILEG